MTGYGAVVLAAGFGKRLRPLTEHVPKALAPLFTVPLVDHALVRLLRLRPPPRVVWVNLHHLPQPLVDHLGDGRRYGVDLRFSLEEPEILGTGGALRRVQSEISRAPFFLVNGDVYFDAPLSRLAEVLAASPGAGGVIGLARDPGRPELALVATNDEGTVVRAIGDRPSPPPEDAPRWIFAGAHLATPALFEHLPAAGFACVVRDGYLPMMAARRELRAVAYPDAAWHDLGTAATYLRAHLELFPAIGKKMRGVPGWACTETAPGVFTHAGARVQPGARLRPPVVIDDGARVGSGATVGPFVVLGAKSAVRDGVRLTRSVVWKDAEVDRSLDGAIVSPAVTILTAARVNR